MLDIVKKKATQRLQNAVSHHLVTCIDPTNSVDHACDKLGIAPCAIELLTALAINAHGILSPTSEKPGHGINIVTQYDYWRSRCHGRAGRQSVTDNLMEYISFYTMICGPCALEITKRMEEHTIPDLDMAVGGELRKIQGLCLDCVKNRGPPPNRQCRIPSGDSEEGQPFHFTSGFA